MVFAITYRVTTKPLAVKSIASTDKAWIIETFDRNTSPMRVHLKIIKVTHKGYGFILIDVNRDPAVLLTEVAT